MPSVRSGPVAGEPDDHQPRRLPLRWALIIATAGIAALAIGASEGLAGGVGAFFVIAGALHMIVA